MRLAGELVRENLRFALAIVALSLGNGALNALLVAVVTRALANDGTRKLALLGCAFVGVCFLSLVFRYGHRYAVTVVSNRLEHALRSRLAVTILGCRVQELEQRRPAELLTVLTRDVETISGFVLSLPAFLSNVALLCGALLYLGYISSYSMVLIVLSMVACGLLLHARIAARNMPLFHEIRARYTRLLRYYQDLAFGAKEFKMDQAMAQRLLGRQILPESDAMQDLNLATVRRHSLGLNVAQITFYAMLGGVVFVYPLLAEASPQTISVCVIVLLFAMAPAESIANIHPLLSNARVAFAHIEQLQAELAAGQEISNAKPEGAPFRALELTDVTFAYPAAQSDSVQGARIGPICLRIQRGDVVFLTGGNGSGKTTLGKLACGLYRPHCGTIALNGNVLHEATIEELRQHFSVTFSDSPLPSAAIDTGETSAAWQDHLVERLGIADILKRFAAAQADEFSAGQRRRVALYLAMKKHKDVYLFDEPCANLDPELKRWFYREMIPELSLQGATLIVISHDDQFFDVASRVITLRDGRITLDRGSAGQKSASYGRV